MFTNSISITTDELLSSLHIPRYLERSGKRGGKEWKKRWKGVEKEGKLFVL
jgi:hypothetical protein